jgi:hypothetical protein
MLHKMLSPVSVVVGVLAAASAQAERLIPEGSMKAAGTQDEVRAALNAPATRADG